MKQFFIMTVGFSLSGKSTLARKIEALNPNELVIISTNPIHDFLNSTYNIFKDDNTVEGPGYKIRDKTTKDIQDVLIKDILGAGFSVIYDACNSKKEKRQKFLDIVRNNFPKVTIMIVKVNIKEDLLYQRLNAQDSENISKGEKPTWVELYEKVQKPSFEEPTSDECDILFQYSENKEIQFLKKIKALIQSK